MKFPIAALVFAVLAAGCTGRDVRGPFRNQYIDAETGKPIEGVVFLAVWESVTPTLTGDGGRSFYEAQEAVSDVDGRVEIPGLSTPPLRIAVNVRFYAFAPNYAYATNATHVTPAGGRTYVDTTVTRMRPLTSHQERCEEAHRTSVIPSFYTASSSGKMERYISTLNRERDELECGVRPRVAR